MRENENDAEQEDTFQFQVETHMWSGVVFVERERERERPTTMNSLLCYKKVDLNTEFNSTEEEKWIQLTKKTSHLRSNQSFVSSCNRNEPKKE